MTEAEDSRVSKIRRDFARQFFEDQDAEAERSLEDYQAMYPEHREVVASCYRLLQSEVTATGTGLPGAFRRVGPEIGPYRVLRELGRGGQGAVYLAEDTRLSRKVAVKVLTGFWGADAALVLERFRREAEVASKLQHPGICPVYEVQIDAEIPYLVMPYLEGRPLSELLRGYDQPTVELSDAERSGEKPAVAARVAGEVTQLEPARALRLIEQVARALHAAHEASVVHRDVKPANIMVLTDGRPVVLDLGIARTEDRDLPTLTQSGVPIGTLPYMSPEQVQGHALDRRTDVYALGVTLYECLTGSLPFDAPTQQQLYHDILNARPPDPRKLNAAISSDLRVVVETALEKDATLRYQTAADLADEIERVREHRPILARSVGPWTRFRQWARRNPGLALAVSAAFVILTVGLTVSLVLLGQVRSEKQRAEDLVGEKQRALDEVDRLADLKLLRDLRKRADSLWPARRARVPDMTSWLEKADALAGRASGHRASLEALRAVALPYSEALRRKDRAARPDLLQRLDRLARQRELIAESKSRRQRRRLEKMDEEIEDIEAELDVRRSWDFRDGTLAWRHETLATLVEELAGFPDLISRLRRRQTLAEDVERRSVDAYAERWKTCIAQVARHPRYGGFALRPQIGLVPLGPDPQSGLFEFGHLESGTLAERRTPRDPITVGEDTGLVFVLLPGGRQTVGAWRPGSQHPRGRPFVDPWADDGSEPVQVVELTPFLVSKFEMTQGQWMRMNGKNPSLIRPIPGEPDASVGDLRHPVEQITFDDCHRLLWRRRLGLPTEAQWEHAARSGTTTPFYSGADVSSLLPHENLADEGSVAARGPGKAFVADMDDGHVYHAPVGSFLPNPWGLHDVLGNVSELCQDDFCRLAESPARPGDGLRVGEQTLVRAIRGGSFNHDATSSTCGRRRSLPRNVNSPSLGLRPIFLLE